MNKIRKPCRGNRREGTGYRGHEDGEVLLKIKGINSHIWIIKVLNLQLELL